MTISSEQPLSFSEFGNGVTTVFDSPANMAVTKASDWRVFFVVDATGVRTEQLAGFTVLDAGTVASGPVNWKAGSRFTFTPAPPSGTTIVFERDPDMTQETALDQHGGFPADRVEGNDDKLTILLQVLAARFDGKTLRLPVGTDIDWAALEPAEGYVGLDADFQPIILAGPSDVAIAAAMVPVVQAASLAAARAVLGLVIGTDVAPVVNITAGAGLTGGGTTAADRSVAVGQGTGIIVNADDVAIDKATQANQEAGTSNKVVTSDVQHYHPSSVKCEGYVTYSAGAPTLVRSYNVTGVTDAGVGRLGVTIGNDFSGTSYSVGGSASLGTSGGSGAEPAILGAATATRAAGSVELEVRAVAKSLQDPIELNFQFCGDQ